MVQKIEPMNYKETIEYIHSTQKFGSILGLDRITMLLEHLGNPQKELKFVHIAGTNGKGSTAAFINSILCEAGYKVGIFTSPSIHRFSERIKINENEISEEDIVRITNIVKEKISMMIKDGMTSPTEFELVTALAMQYFFEQCCDIIILEVGMGGRLDSTNIIDTPEVAVITTIDFDHIDVLGNTLSKIALEKAGIIKENCDVVLYSQESFIERVFEDECKERNAKLSKVDFSSLVSLSSDTVMQEFDFEGYKSLKISLMGNHQKKNAAVAVKTAEILRKKGFEITEDAITKGLSKAKWAGRFEVVNNVPMVVVDGAHNIQGVKILSENLIKYFPGKKITFIAGVLADKDYRTMMKFIIPIAHKVITVTPDSSRALSADKLAFFLKAYHKNVFVGEKVHKAIMMSLNSCSKDEIICAFGSLYYVGEVREFFGLR